MSRSSNWLILCLALFCLVVLVMPFATQLALRVSLFGEWGYRHLVSNETKAAWINEFYKGNTDEVALGTSAPVRYSGTSVSLVSVNSLKVVVKDDSRIIASRTWTPLNGGSYHGKDLTLIYTSPTYPLQITITIIRVNRTGGAPGGSGSGSICIKARAEPDPPVAILGHLEGFTLIDTILTDDSVGQRWSCGAWLLLSDGTLVVRVLIRDPDNRMEKASAELLVESLAEQILELNR